MKFLEKIAIGFLLFSASSADAHPVSYKHAIGVMTWNQSFLSDYWVTYSFRPDMAIAGRFMRMDMPEGEIHTYFPQFDYLVNRWNEKEYQANIYVFGGFGGVNFNGRSGTTPLWGFEADAESTRLFVMAKGEWMRPSVGPNFDHYEARVGIAPYEAEFNEIAAWLMLQYQYHPSLARRQVLTPLARLFYRNVLWEMGASIEGDFMANLMFHF